MFVTLVRQTATQWRQLGQPVLTLARATQDSRHGAMYLAGEQRPRLDPQLPTAIEAQQRIASPSRRLTPGKALRHGNIVHADDPTIAPSGTGNSHCPAPCGRKPGIIAAPAAGFSCAGHLPVGNPGDASDVAPLVTNVEQAMAQGGTRPPPAIHARAGALALKDTTLRAALHERGILPVGMPRTVDPLPPSPTPEDVLRGREAADWPHLRTPSQVQLAYACGYSRPVVESSIASLLGRGAGCLTDKGHRGASVHTGMAVLAHHAATLVRIQAYRLSKRARLFRRRLRLRCRQVSRANASIN